MRIQSLDDRLVTAQILYRLPDFKSLLQTYVWQNIDTLPHYPKLNGFLDFWETKLEGKLYRVTIAASGLVLFDKPFRHANVSLLIH